MSASDVLGCWCLGRIGDDPFCPCIMRKNGLEPTRPGRHADFLQGEEVALPAPAYPVGYIFVPTHNTNRTDDSKRCRWPDCDCYSAQGPQECRKAATKAP